MNDSQWDAKLKAFLQKTGADFKRFGTDVKGEAQKLLSEVQDPARQQKLREGLQEVGTWARKTAEDVATLVESGVKKVESGVKKTEVVLERAGHKVNDLVSRSVEAAPAPAATPPSPPPEMDEAPRKPAPRPKTVGKGAPKKKAPGGRAPAAKTIGRKRPHG